MQFGNLIDIFHVLQFFLICSLFSLPIMYVKMLDVLSEASIKYLALENTMHKGKPSSPYTGGTPASANASSLNRMCFTDRPGAIAEGKKGT